MRVVALLAVLSLTLLGCEKINAPPPTPTVTFLDVNNVAPPFRDAARRINDRRAGGNMDCSDFATWEEAQTFYRLAGGPTQDPHYLDADRDGVACEALRWK